MSLVHTARQIFSRADGPWRRRAVFEALGSRRYSRPALFGLDRRLEALLVDAPGTFLEAGGHDGFTLSNTYYLERFKGWSGVLVEAIPQLAEKAARRRPRSKVVTAALVGPESAGEEVLVHFGDLTSTLGDPEHAEIGLENAGLSGYDVRVTGKTLSSILDEAGVDSLDLLVLDLEGHEYDALRGLDLDRHRPRLILTEIVHSSVERTQLDELLADHYEFAEMLSPHDALYRRCDEASVRW